MKITDDEIKKICSPTIYKRGLKYYKEGRVHLRTRKPESLVAAVDGEEIYNVHITFDGDKISGTLCTCPYYRTMGCTCKHIVAALKTRQAELDETTDFKNENDRLAAMLCSEFSKEPSKIYRLSVLFRITPVSDKITYSASINLVDERNSYSIMSAENFFNCILTRGQYLISKNHIFSSDCCSFENASQDIADIFTELCENKSTDMEFFSHNSEISFGASTAKRLFPLLEKVDCEYVIDSVSYHNLPVINDNPDILADVTAIGKNITLSVTESGIALIPDGSRFFFENKIFKTTPEWQLWFMPVYRAMITQRRTQLEFAGDNCIEFAAKVLPKIRDCHGVVCYGLDELVVNEKPVFEIYLDRTGNKISAVVKAFYGNVSIVLPCTVYTSEKVIVRDKQSEDNILSFFSQFTLDDNTFTMYDDEEVFYFITQSLNELEKLATLYFSDSFENLTKEDFSDISAAVNYNSKIDLLELTIDTGLSNEELYEILSAYYSSQRYYRLSSGSFLDFSKQNSALELIGSLPYENFEKINGIHRIPKFYSLYLAAQTHNGIISANNDFLNMVNSALNSKAEIPDYLENVLRDYQKNGVHWFCQLSKLGLGGILADDMGLGKTLQVIAFVMSENISSPVLVVAPSSLTYNWLDEIRRFAPNAKAKIIDGPKEEREKSLKSTYEYDFIITSYALLRRDIKIYCDIEFSYCFIDEAQHIKNSDTMNAHAVKLIKAKCFFALTGTPIENSLSELWSIFDFVLHGYLATKKEFSAKYEKKSALVMNDLRNKIKPFILRRMKKDVLHELPEKIENTIFADFEPEQKQIYSAFLATARKEADIISANGDNAIRILSLLTRLRQICCHPRLINPEYKKDSGKLMLLNELVLSAIDAGHRILIFSQFTSMLNIISEKLIHENIDCFYLDGSTPSAQRLNMVNRFNSGEKSVFLISLKAGGMGLNLVGADMVIHYDPWWNPAVMDQASDRAYRIGQTRAVQVIKLAARNSIEEQILKLAEKKRGLAEGLIRENTNLLSALTKEELLELFKE